MFINHAIILAFFLIFSLIYYIFGIQAPIAQSVEQIPFKDKVVGSIPTGRTIESIL